jgi:serine/threonine protein phosphatase PrpC
MLLCAVVFLLLVVQVGLFCVFDGHNSRNASEQAQQLLPDYLAESLTQQRQQQEEQQQLEPPQQQQQQQDPHHQQQQQQPSQQQEAQQSQQQQQQQVQVLDSGDPPQIQQQGSSNSRPMLSDEVGVAAALTASFLATDEALTTDDGCTATAVLLEGCGDGGLLLRVANVGDSLALLINLTR